MISRDTRLAIKATWALYAQPLDSQAAERVSVGLAVLAEAPEATVAKLGNEALSFWRGFWATGEGYPRQAAARLRAVDARLRALAEKIARKEAA